MKIRYSITPALTILVLILTGLYATGCANFNLGSSTPQDTAPAPAAQEPEDVKKPTAMYHDFEDVLVPMELGVVKDRTMIVSTPGFRSGILTLRGRVESNSLFNFFSNNMEKDNWQVLSRIKSPETTIMVYQKTSRCAVITIRDEQLYTYVEISVAPTVGGGTSPKTGTLTY